MGQRLSSKLLFISLPNTNGFCIFYISQGSATTQLRCAGKLSNHFITNFPRNAPVKQIENRPILDKDVAKSSWLTFWGPPCRLLHLLSTSPVQTSCQNAGRSEGVYTYLIQAESEVWRWHC